MKLETNNLPRFGFLFANTITLDERGADFGTYPPPSVTPALRKEVVETLEPALVASGFFTKTKFLSLSVCIEFCSEKDLSFLSSVEFKIMRSKALLLVTKRFSWARERSKTEQEWKNFLLCQIGQILLETALQYKLNDNEISSQVNTLLNRENELTLADSEEHEISEVAGAVDVIVIFELPKDPNNAYLFELFALEDVIERALLESRIGSVVGHSVSADSFDIECSGDNGETLMQFIRKALIGKKLFGNVCLEISEEGNTRRVSLQEGG